MDSSAVAHLARIIFHATAAAEGASNNNNKSFCVAATQ